MKHCVSCLICYIKNLGKRVYWFRNPIANSIPKPVTVQFCCSNAALFGWPVISLEPAQKPKLGIATINQWISAFQTFVAIYTVRSPTDAPAVPHCLGIFHGVTGFDVWGKKLFTLGNFLLNFGHEKCPRLPSPLLWNSARPYCQPANSKKSVRLSRHMRKHWY